MSDMKKVFVTLVDADGVEHRVAGWRVPESNFVQNGQKVSAPDSEDWWYVEVGGEVAIEPAPEPLPTGLGAVVKVTYPPKPGFEGDMVEIMVLAGRGEWFGTKSMDVYDEVHIRGHKYEILSPGVEVNR